MDRTHRSVVALAHGEEHREDLGAANLADDDPLRVHAQRRADELGEAEGPDAFGVGFTGFERLVVGVEVLEALESDLQGVLDCDEALVGWDLVDQAPQGRGLPGAGSAGHDDVGPSPHRSRQEAGRQVVAHAELDELGHAVDVEVVAADRHRRATRHRHEGMKAITVRELQVQLRVRVIPATLAATDAPRRGGDQLDEILVGVRHGGPADLRAVAQVEPDPQRARDVDVPDVWVVEQWLEAGEPVDAVQDSRGDLRFGGLVERHAPVRVRGRCQLAKFVGHQLASQRTFIGWREPPPPSLLVRHMGRGQCLANAVVQVGNQRRIDPVALPRPRAVQCRGHDAATAVVGSSSTELSATPRAPTARASCERARWEREPPTRSTSAASGSLGS